MGRHGYTEDCDDNWQMIQWRGRVTSAARGRRGQAFFRHLIEALDAMPEKRLVKAEEYEIVTPTGEACALGSIALARGWDDAKDIDASDHDALASRLDIAPCLVQETEYENDECGPWAETPEGRWLRIRKWAEKNIKESPAPSAAGGAEEKIDG